MQHHVGTIKNEDETTFEVLVEVGPHNKPSHVYVIDIERQIADFPINAPNAECEISVAAQLIASGKAVHIELPLLVVEA